MFQCKALDNIIYANKMFFKFGKVTSPRGSLCKLQDETIMHLFYDSLIVKKYRFNWNLYYEILFFR